MTAESPADTVRAVFQAYLDKDRAAIERLIADNFSFSSPYDDHIDRAAYFERCWPGSEATRTCEILRLFEQGEEVFVLYEADFGEGAFRNVEFQRVVEGRVVSVEVYFGDRTKGEA